MKLPPRWGHEYFSFGCDNLLQNQRRGGFVSSGFSENIIRFAGSCPVSRAHKTSLRSILFCICRVLCTTMHSLSPCPKFLNSSSHYQPMDANLGR